MSSVTSFHPRGLPLAWRLHPTLLMGLMCLLLTTTGCRSVTDSSKVFFDDVHVCARPDVEGVLPSVAPRIAAQFGRDFDQWRAEMVAIVRDMGLPVAICAAQVALQRLREVKTLLPPQNGEWIEIFAGEHGYTLRSTPPRSSVNLTTPSPRLAKWHPTSREEDDAKGRSDE